MSKIKFQRKFLAIPYGIFLVLFVVIPMVLIVVYAFSKTDPVTNKTTFSFENLTTFFSNSYNLLNIFFLRIDPIYQFFFRKKFFLVFF